MLERHVKAERTLTRRATPGKILNHHFLEVAGILGSPSQPSHSGTGMAGTTLANLPRRLAQPLRRKPQRLLAGKVGDVPATLQSQATPKPPSQLLGLSKPT